MRANVVDAPLSQLSVEETTPPSSASRLHRASHARPALRRSRSHRGRDHLVWRGWRPRLRARCVRGPVMVVLGIEREPAGRRNVVTNCAASSPLPGRRQFAVRRGVAQQQSHRCNAVLSSSAQRGVVELPHSCTASRAAAALLSVHLGEEIVGEGDRDLCHGGQCTQVHRHLCGATIGAK